MSVGGLWNGYGACELKMLLLACQQHRIVVYFESKTDTHKVAPHILSIQSLLSQLAFVPFLWPQILEASSSKFDRFRTRLQHNLRTKHRALLRDLSNLQYTNEWSTDASPEAIALRNPMNVFFLNSRARTDNRITSAKTCCKSLAVRSTIPRLSRNATL